MFEQYAIKGLLIDKRIKFGLSQQTFTFSKSTIETPKKGVKYVQS